MKKEILYTNRKATYNYQIVEKFEAGIQLYGSEVKGCLDKSISLQDSYITIDKGELIMYNSYIGIMNYMNKYYNCKEKRNRKLLMHKREILKLANQVKTKGLTIIPLSMYLNEHRFIKVEIALVKGKHNYDKKEALKEKILNRELKNAR